MILRLVYSFFFFSLVTGNQWSQNEHPTHGLISTNPPHSITPQAHIEPTYDVEFESDEGPNIQVPQRFQYVDEETDYTERTICFTPAMVHKMIKAVLEYASQMPSEINNIIDNLGLEFYRMPYEELMIEENDIKRPMYPLDSKTIFQMLDKPRSKGRTSVILKYELPSLKEPICRQALEKLIEIAYTAYMELEQHPQCREFLYDFAAHQPEDRPTGNLDREPDLKALITSILDQVNKHKPKLDITLGHDRYGDIGIPQIPQNLKYIIPQEYNIPQKPQVLEYNIHKYTVPEVPEYNVPQPYELVFNQPNYHEYSEYRMPRDREYSIPQNQKYNVPTIHEYTSTQNHEYNVPNVHEYSITPTHEYNVPQIRDIVRPQVQSIKFPSIHETIEKTTPIKPEETVNILKKLLKQGDHPENGNLFDRLTNVLQENKNNFHPNILKVLLTVLSAHKQHNIPRFNDIFLLLLDSQRKRDWPWSDRVTELLLSHVIPDRNGNLDPRIVEIILNLYKKRPNENNIEFILSLLRPLKEENMDARLKDIVLRLIHLYQNNLFRPDHVDILLKLLKPSQNGGSSPVEIDIVDNLSRWTKIGISPKQLDGIFALLKPYVNGQTDRRPIDILHFLFTKRAHLNPKHLDFILSFLYPVNGILDSRRIDIIDFLLRNVSRFPKHANILLNLLQKNAPSVLSSRFLEILLFLNTNRLLTPELVGTIINLLTSEVTGQIKDNQVKTLFIQLAPFKQTNPKLVVDVLTLLNQGGLHGNIVEWLDNNVGLPSRESKPNLKLLIQQDNTEYRTPVGGYQEMEQGRQASDQDFMSIFKWLESQGLITPDQGSNTDLVNKVLNVLKVGQRDLGAVELTYMLKHEKPLIYQPVYYVKYRLPILSFISNMKALLMENPNLNADPMKLLQELILISNVTEVSPNLQGYPKEEILKLTFNDGDLVQAKILDEQNLSLNDQITYVHGLNSDITPEEILQLNRMNEAKYFPNLLEIKGVHPDKLTFNEVDRFIDVPPVHYRYVDQIPGVMPQTKTIHQKFIARANQKQDPLLSDNAHLMPQD